MPVNYILDAIVVVCSLVMCIMLILSTTLHIASRRSAERHQATDNDARNFPTVSIIVPVCNEDPVLIKNLLERIAEVDWPRDKLEILIVDDSEEKVYTKIRQVAEETARRLNLNVKILRRGSRKGYKAGALNYALRHAKGELISVLDVDVRPRREYLRVLYSYLTRNYDYVQGLTEFKPVINTLTSLIAKFQEEYLNNTLYKFYSRNVFLRGHTFLIKRRILEDVGGFSESAGRLTEDVELTIRLRLRGARGVLAPVIVSEGLVAISYGCYLLQRARWVTGSLIVLLRYFPKVVTSKILSLRDKLEITHSLLTRTSSLAFLICALSPLLYHGLAISATDVVFKIVILTYIVALLYLCVSSRGSGKILDASNIAKAIASSLLWISTAPFILIYMLCGGKWYVTPKTLGQVGYIRPVIGVIYSVSMLILAMLSVAATLSNGLLLLLPVSAYLLLSLVFSTVLSIVDLVKIYRSIFTR